LLPRLRLRRDEPPLSLPLSLPLRDVPLSLSLPLPLPLLLPLLLELLLELSLRSRLSVPWDRLRTGFKSGDMRNMRPSPSSPLSSADTLSPSSTTACAPRRPCAHTQRQQTR
jgi:hypothetical protein